MTRHRTFRQTRRNFRYRCRALQSRSKLVSSFSNVMKRDSSNSNSPSPPEDDSFPFPVPIPLSFFNTSLIPCVLEFSIPLPPLNDPPFDPAFDPPPFPREDPVVVAKLDVEERAPEERRRPPLKPDERALAKTDLWPILRSDKEKGSVQGGEGRRKRETRRDEPTDSTTSDERRRSDSWNK